MYVNKKVSTKIIPGQHGGSAAKDTCHTSLVTQVDLQNTTKEKSPPSKLTFDLPALQHSCAHTHTT